MDALATQLILGRTQGLSARRLRSALTRAAAGGCSGSGLSLAAAAALVGERPGLLETLGFSRAASVWLHAPDRALIERDREWLARERVELIDAFSAGFPPLLAASGVAPAVLYVRGSSGSLHDPQLAIVGTRHPTMPGRQTAVQFAMDLSCAGLTITSGLALGIDAAAHGAALGVGGRTIAVLGSGLDRIYPPQHAALAARVAAQGALVSEFPRGTPPRGTHFARRNRLISGLSLGTLVIEAGCCSGALITARQAHRQGRALFAVPGSIRNPLARGCHALLRDGARLAESAADILEPLGICSQKQSHTRGRARPDRFTARAASLDKGHKILLDALGFEPASLDTLVERTGFPSQAVVSMLLILELNGAIGSEVGGRYVRLDPLLTPTGRNCPT